MEKELTLEEKWKQAGLSNNFIFYKVFRNNPKECKHLLELLLGFKISRIVMSQEETILTDPNSKGIRMDIYIQTKNECIDLELQAIDTKELSERARYYQSVMDVDILKAGKFYKELKTSYVVFLCMTDVFGNGLPVYSFETLCIQNPAIRMNDRTYKHFFIANNYDKIENENQRRFFKLLAKGESEDTFTKRLSSLIEEAKQNSQWKVQFMEYERQRAYDRAAGYEQGLEAKAIEVAIAFLKEGLSFELIAKCINIPISQVKELAEQLEKQKVNA